MQKFENQPVETDRRKGGDIQPSRFAYVMITPARNEELYIEKTIQSMISQTVLPKMWIVVSDGSTDHTDDIVKGYLPDHPWMEFIRLPERSDRNFASKVYGFNAGYEKAKDISYDIIGNLDADLSFQKDYFEYLLGQFAACPELGVAGTPFIEDSTTSYDYRFANIEHVPGGCQLFRRQCFEAIGGYVPIRGGGIDWVAVTTARMKGWRTQSFTERTLFHHRKMGTGKGNVFSAKFRLGKEDYYLGSDPLWAFLRAFYQMRYKPYILGGLFILMGYMTSTARRLERPVPAELVKFYRKEQRQRLRRMLSKAIGPS
jgi:glycosyltransferase involved in cell wall biosynthesis